MNGRELKLELAADLGLSPEDFAHLWNSSPEYATVATADTERGRGILGVDSINEVIVVLGNIMVGVASSAVYDVIRRALAARNIRVKLREIGEENGTVIVKAELESPSHGER